MTTQDISEGFIGDRLYHEIRAFAEEASAHSRVRSERKLAAQYGLSHSTVRRVVQRLADEGRVYKIHGKGVFVAERNGATTPNAAGTVLFADDWQDVEHPFHARYLRGLVAQARESGLRLQIQQLSGDADQRGHALEESLRGGDISGLIISWLTAGIYHRIGSMIPAIVTTVAPVAEARNVHPVLRDWQGVGEQAALWLQRRGARHALLIHHRGAVLDGATQALDREGATLALEGVSLCRPNDSAQVRNEILGHAPCALAFDDDRLAAEVLAGMSVSERKRWQPVISVANRGEDLLPIDVARLDFDGEVFGRQAVHSIVTALRGDLQHGAATTIPATLVEP